MQKRTKASFRAELKRIEKEIERGYTRSHNLRAAYVRQNCPFKPGDVVRVRQGNGHLLYVQIRTLEATENLRSKGPYWVLWGRQCKADGTPSTRRREVHLSENGTLEIELIKLPA